MKTLYTARASAIGGRDGIVRTDDNKLSFKLGRTDPLHGTNPEQLFACGYASCFGSSVEIAARQQNLHLGSVTVSAQIDLIMDEAGGFLLSAVLDVALPGMDRDTAVKLLRAAHATCPYSKVTRGNMQVTLKANQEPLAI